MKYVAAVIPARGGSKGIPRKNLVSVCGRPLLAWSIDQARRAARISDVWVTSDSPEILELAEQSGARPIERPAEISHDRATSEDAWLHALEHIEAARGPVDAMVGMQATSPLRDPRDLDAALADFERRGLDSMLSCCEVEDFFMWRLDDEQLGSGANHDPDHRQPRQLIEKRYLENGSFYIFRPALLRARRNRLGGRVGIHVMPRYTMHQIDSPADITLCEVLMRGYGIAAP